MSLQLQMAGRLVEILKDLEGIDRRLIGLRSRDFSGGAEENHEESHSECRHLNPVPPEKILEYYRYTSLLCLFAISLLQSY
jgi:hypothetical protein